MVQNKSLLWGLLAWYLVLSGWTAYSPVDREFWAIVSILPALAVVGLIALHRWMPFSTTSYVLIAMFLSLHTISGVAGPLSGVRRKRGGE